MYPKDPLKEFNVLNCLKRLMALSCLVAALGLAFGCTHFQPTKNVWKGTKDLWTEYVSPPAEIDYDQKGELSDVDRSMVTGMMRIDIELTKLERQMLNADRPPTRGWLNELFTSVTWLDGFAGIKADGTLLGAETYPGRPEKELDFNRILHEDPKQNTRSMRCDVDMTEYGPEVIIAMPIYDGVDFLGAVAAYFDMAELAAMAGSPQDVVILTPYGLLWPGRYDFGATPLAEADWDTLVTKTSQGTVDNATGTFAYQVRYMGNLPIIFAVVEKGDFPGGASTLEQTRKYAKKREKVGPPPVVPRTRPASGSNAFGAPEQPSDGLPTDEEIEAEQQRMMEAQRQREAAIRQQQEQMRRQRAAQMEQARRAEEQRRLLLQQPVEEEPVEPMPVMQRPSPFGPRGGAAESAAPAVPETPSETPAGTQADTQTETGSSTGPAPATLPGGRPSPFGPRTEQQPAKAAPEPAPVRRARPSPFGPREESAAAPAAPAETPAAPAAPAETPAAAAGAGETAAGQASEKASGQPATLPGGRPSPFGPRN